MKANLTFFFACCITSISQATILTICPNTTYPAQYSTIQSANDAAAPGDTLYIYPADYQINTTITKRLVIIGPGIDPHRPTRLTATSIGTFHIIGPDCSGSTIMGLTFSQEMVAGDYTNTVNNLTITECRFNTICQLFGNNILVENCILECNDPSAWGYFQFMTISAYGNIIQNDFVHGNVRLGPGSNTIVRNNIFASGTANTVALSANNNGYTFGPGVQIFNNIFYKSNPNAPNGVSDDCAYINNLYYLTGGPPPSNLLSSGNLNADPQFVNFPASGAGFSFNYDYHLQPTSPGIGYGTDGNDVGMWGGAVPVNAGFEPPIPRITELKLSNSTVPVGGTLQMTLKATKAL